MSRAVFVACALVLSLAQPARAHHSVIAAVPADCGAGAPASSVTGEFGREMQGSYVMVPFTVSVGTTRVEVRLCYDQPESPTSSQIRHVLDLGLYEPKGADGFWDIEEFRGWGGSSRPTTWVSPKDAQVGFKPGPIPEGLWAAEIGVAAVADQSEGDSDALVAWRMEVHLSNDPSNLMPPWTPAPYNESAVQTQTGWYKGDFHVHARHSNPNDASMEETFDCAFNPAKSNLDFITLSDYVTDRHWDEIGNFQGSYPGKLILRSAEVITYRGHINNHGTHQFVEYRTGPIFDWNGGTPVEIRDPVPPSQVFDAIHAAGGWTQVNHPTIFPSTVPAFANICRGCSWEYSDAETGWTKVDSYEIATGPGGLSQPVGNEPGPNPFTLTAIQRFDELRRNGFPITAVGGSDSHNACAGNGTTQSPIGEPTTVVFAEELSEPAIQKGILAGHAFVKLFASGGADLRLDAQPKGGGPSVMMGDAIDVPTAEFEARVLGGMGIPPRTLLIYQSGTPIAAVPVTSNDFVHTFEASARGDYRLQLMRGTAIEAFSNPIILGTRGQKTMAPASGGGGEPGGLATTGTRSLQNAGLLLLLIAGILLIRVMLRP